MNYQLDYILIKCINEGVGNNIYDGLKDLYSKNKYPSNIINDNINNIHNIDGITNEKRF